MIKKFKKRPKLRISLYKYNHSFGAFLIAFWETALKQGWTNKEIQFVFRKTDNMEDLDALDYLMQYACIVKLPKGYRIKNGQAIQNNNN